MTVHRLSSERPSVRDEIQVLSTDFGFIPGQLNVPGRPELAVFPNSVVFMSTVRCGDKIASAGAAYHPVLESYQDNEASGGRGQRLAYGNIHGPSRAYLRISFEASSRMSYKAQKLVDGSLVGTVAAEEWNDFFRQLTLLGLTKDEPFEWVREGEGDPN